MLAIFNFEQPLKTHSPFTKLNVCLHSSVPFRIQPEKPLHKITILLRCFSLLLTFTGPHINRTHALGWRSTRTIPTEWIMQTCHRPISYEFGKTLYLNYVCTVGKRRNRNAPTNMHSSRMAEWPIREKIRIATAGTQLIFTHQKQRMVEWKWGISQSTSSSAGLVIQLLGNYWHIYSTV